MKVEFYKHNITEVEKQKVSECLDGVFLTTGPLVSEFEEKLGKFLDVSNTVGLTSCTAALHLSLVALGIGPGDEVITTPCTFIATVNPILYTGATPVFVDCDVETGLIDPELIEEAVTEKTKAIIPIHLYGQMCDMRAIRQIADKHKLYIIEDAAHCIEGERDGYRPGTLGDTACFSFYATKNITSGEGGAVVTNNQELAENLRLLRCHGMTKNAADRYTNQYQHWDMDCLGWKYNMSNIQAAMLLNQLEHLNDFWKKRDRIAQKYFTAFNDAKSFRMLKILSECKSAYHLFTILVAPKKRDEILRQLQEKDIGVAVNYRAVHLLKYYVEKFNFKRGSFPNSELIGDSTISIPLYPRMTDEQVDYVIQMVQETVSC